MNEKQIQIIAISSVGVVIAVILLFSSIYIVNRTEQVVVTQFGKPVTVEKEEGPHFKIPFIQSVNRIEKRILEWDGTPVSMRTLDQLYIQVDSFARWRITDPLKYFKSLTNERTAQSRLDGIFRGPTNEVVAKYNLVELIRTTKGREPEAGGEGVTTLDEIEFGRDFLEDEILRLAREELKNEEGEEDLGIELIDFRFKRINYQDEKVIQSIYTRMRSEREQIAEKTRAEGDKEAASILGDMAKELKKIESEAYKTVQETRGKADAEATTIYASAYNQSPEAMEFYQFLQTMEAYRMILTGDTTVVLTTDSDLFEYFKGINPELRKPIDWTDPALHPDREQLPLFLRDN